MSVLTEYQYISDTVGALFVQSKLKNKCLLRTFSAAKGGCMQPVKLLFPGGIFRGCSLAMDLTF